LSIGQILGSLLGAISLIFFGICHVPQMAESPIKLLSRLGCLNIDSYSPKIGGLFK